ncbi:hypothetical protein F4808DRAFT_432533 [Astrocystis sublimbata]|nr:hypothetical protein F4808DRAFT_432533 [Astrocystis sublimbata]
MRDFGNDVRGPLYCIGSTLELPELTVLSSSNLHFLILSQLGGLQIKWVDSVCMHLELRRKDRILMLFRHPSVCALMCQSGDEGIYLDNFFRHYFSSSGQSLPAILENKPAAIFYREVLLTYRLLFGQHKKSWKLCRKIGKIKGTHRRSWRRSWPWNRASQPDDYNLPHDSLLQRLCCSEASFEPFYDDIEAPLARSAYSAQHDFPFFGDRLVALQEYIQLVEPTDMRSAYYDRRDLSKFINVWFTVVFGLITLILSILGVLLAAGQIATSFQPG